MSDASEILETAITIATGGVSKIKHADREHSKSNPAMLYKLSKLMEADAYDEADGGFLNIEFGAATNGVDS